MQQSLGIIPYTQNRKCSSELNPCQLTPPSVYTSGLTANAEPEGISNCNNYINPTPMNQTCCKGSYKDDANNPQILNNHLLITPTISINNA